MRRVQKTIGRKPETKLPLIFAVLRVLYTNELLVSIHELANLWGIYYDVIVQMFILRDLTILVAWIDKI